MGQVWTLSLSTLELSIAASVIAFSTYVAIAAGVLSFASVAFAAIGGYAIAKVLPVVPVPDLGVPLSFVIGAVGGGLLAVISLPLLRLSSHWLALATVALVLVVNVLIVNLPGLTGGTTGLSVPLGMSIWWALGVLALVCLLLARLYRSKYGMAALAVREDPAVAAGIGVPVFQIQAVALVLSGILGGLGGVLWAGFLGYISSDTFYVSLAVIAVAAVVLGGAYSWKGALVGATILTAIPTILGQFISEGEGIVNGMLLLAIVLWLPGGLIDPRRGRRRAQSRRHA